MPTPPARRARATAQGAPRPDRSALVAASWRLRSQHTGATPASRGLLPAASPSPASWGSARPPLASGVATPQESDLVCAPGSVRESNIVAAKAVADAVRTSLGPRGMDKMVPPARLTLRGLRGEGARSRPPQGHVHHAVG